MAAKKQPSAKLRKKKSKSSSQVKSTHSTKFALMAIGIIILGILLNKLFNFVQSLNEPSNPDILVEKRYTWDEKTSINIAVKTNSVMVLNYDPQTKQVVILKIPDDVYFDLPKGYGTWRVGSIFDLGQENSPPVGAELLKQSLSKLLGLPIDGFITMDDSQLSSQPLDQTINSWHNNPLTILSAMKKIKTDLTPLEAFKLLTSLSGVRPDQITMLDIANTDITNSKLLPDGSRALGIDQVSLDTFIRQYMADSTISQENVPVAIFNATDHPGLAQDASREVTNLGGNVIFVSNSDQHLSKTEVVVNDKSETADRMVEIFAPWCAKQKCTTRDQKILIWHASIDIIIGEDFYKDKYQHSP